MTIEKGHTISQVALSPLAGFQQPIWPGACFIQSRRNSFPRQGNSYHPEKSTGYCFEWLAGGTPHALRKRQTKWRATGRFREHFGQRFR
jgi:hypothetical protein